MLYLYAVLFLLFCCGELRLFLCGPVAHNESFIYPPYYVCFPVVTPHCGCIFTARSRALASSFSRFLDHKQRRATLGRTSLDEWSIRRRDFYLTTHNTHNRQTSMPPVGFEHTISAGERPKTYALDRAATGTGKLHPLLWGSHINYKIVHC